MGPYAGADYTVNSPPDVHSKVDSNTFTMVSPMPESTVTICLRVDFNPQSGILDLAFAVWTKICHVETSTKSLL
jgi:hypothetical protein